MYITLDKRLENIFFLGAGCFLFFKMTKYCVSLDYKLKDLDTKFLCMKERLEDLELFKLKVYQKEISLGSRAWSEEDEDLFGEESEVD